MFELGTVTAFLQHTMQTSVNEENGLTGLADQYLEQFFGSAYSQGSFEEVGSLVEAVHQGPLVAALRLDDLPAQVVLDRRCRVVLADGG